MGTVEKFAKEINEATDAEDAKAPIPFEEDKKPAGRVLEDTGDNKDYAGAAKLIAAVEAEQAKIDKHAEEYKAAAAPHRDEMARLKKAIRDDYGIESKALGIILADRRQKRRMDARKAALEEPAASQFKQLEMAL